MTLPPPDRPEVFSRLVSDANRSGVTFYTLDTRGLSIDDPMTASVAQQNRIAGERSLQDAAKQGQLSGDAAFDAGALRTMFNCRQYRTNNSLFANWLNGRAVLQRRTPMKLPPRCATALHHRKAQDLSLHRTRPAGFTRCCAARRPKTRPGIHARDLERKRTMLCRDQRCECRRCKRARRVAQSGWPFLTRAATHFETALLSQELLH